MRSYINIFYLLIIICYLTGCSPIEGNIDLIRDKAGEGSIVPVTDITPGFEASYPAGSSIPLTGEVIPGNATNKVINWTVKNAGTTGSVINGNELTVSAEGVVIVTAVIKDGRGKDTDFTKDFSIEVFNNNTTETYTVRFESRGGSNVLNQTIPEGESVSQPPDPTRAGWVFSNWYSDIDLTVVYNFSSPVFSDLTLYASWVDVNKPSYTITFNSNGGSAVGSQSVFEGEHIMRPDDPVRAGWAFINWYTDTTWTLIYNFSAPVNSNININARWTAAAVTFDRNGGDAEANPRTILVNTTDIAPRTTLDYLPAQPPVRAGYSFKEWNTLSDGSGEVFSTTTAVIGNITVYAQWILNPVITINTQPAPITNVTVESITGSLSVSATVTQSAALNYQWYSSEVNSNTGGSEINGQTGTSFTIPVTLTTGTYYYYVEVRAAGGAESVRSEVAVVYVTDLPAITYTVTFDKNNNDAGSTEANPQTRSVTTPVTTVTLPTAPTRIGWTFAGWNTEANGSGSAFTDSTTVTADVTVFAQWTANTYTVTFNKNNNDVGSTEPSPQTRQVTTPETTVTLPADPARTGWTFTGWNTQANGSGSAFTATTTVIADITVYAQWIAVGTLNITFANFADIDEPIISAGIIYIIGGTGRPTSANITVANPQVYDTGSIKWYLNNNQLNAGVSGSLNETLTINTTSILFNRIGYYTVTVEVKIEGNLYSKKVTFEVKP